MKIRKSITVVAAVAAVAGGLALAPSAFAETSGTEQFQIELTSSSADVVAHGLFTDGGTDVESNTNYDALVLSQGDIRLTHPDARVTEVITKMNATTCFAKFTQKGGYILGHGTGAYAGIHGHGNYTAKFQLVLSRTDGVCDEDSAPLSQTGTVHAAGPAFLP